MGGRKTLRETGGGEIVVLGKRFQFAITGMLLAGTRGRVVGHENLNQRLARGLDLQAVGVDHHVVFRFADTGSGIDTGADVDYAEPADSDGSFVLLMTECGNGNAVQPRGIEDRGTCRYRDLLIVDGKRDFPDRRHTAPPTLQTPVGQRLPFTCMSTSSRKCRRTD